MAEPTTKNPNDQPIKTKRTGALPALLVIGLVMACGVAAVHFSQASDFSFIRSSSQLQGGTVANAIPVVSADKSVTIKVRAEEMSRTAKVCVHALGALADTKLNVEYDAQGLNGPFGYAIGPVQPVAVKGGDVCVDTGRHGQDGIIKVNAHAGQAGIERIYGKPN